MTTPPRSDLGPPSRDAAAPADPEPPRATPPVAKAAVPAPALPLPSVDLAARSIRTWAWLGDALFELHVRAHLAARGDLPTDRLDAIKTRLVRSESQAALLRAVDPQLDEDERAVVRRARNAAPGSSRGRGDTRTYRDATAFEALVAHWLLGPAPGRFTATVLPALDAAVDQAWHAHRHAPRRG